MSTKETAYVAVMDEEGELFEEVCVDNADLGELAQKYEGSKAGDVCGEHAASEQLAVSAL